MSYAEARETFLVKGILIHRPMVVWFQEKSEVKKKTHVNGRLGAPTIIPHIMILLLEKVDMEKKNDELSKLWIILNLFGNDKTHGTSWLLSLEDNVSFRRGSIDRDLCGLAEW